MSRRKGRVVCIGTCKSGHVTRATSAEGRTTWNGKCAHDGCDLDVFARRAPRQDQHDVSPEAIEPSSKATQSTQSGDPENQDPPNGGAAGKPGSRVVRVEGWASERDERKPATKRAAGRARAASGSASAAAGSGAKAPGRGKRSAADASSASDKRGGSGRGRPNGGAAPDAGQADPAKDDAQGGRGRRIIARARASFGAADQADGPAYDFY